MISLRGFIAICLCGVLCWTGCDDQDGGSFTTQPLASEPAILDAALTVDVSEDRPDGIADHFFDDTDDRIYVWIYWINVSDTHTVEVKWFSPDDDTEPTLSSTEVFNSSTGRQITTFFMDRPTTGFDLGEWGVEIFLDGFFERRYLFKIE